MEQGEVKSNKKKILLILLALILFLSIGTISVQAVQGYRVNNLIDLGNKYLLEGNYEQAILQFEDILKIDKDNVDARVGLAKAYTAVKKYDKAEEVLKTGIKLKPKTAKFYLVLSEVYIAQGNTEGAIQALSEGYEKTKNQEIKQKLDEMTSAIEIHVEKNPLQIGSSTAAVLVQKDKSGNTIKELDAQWNVKDSKVGEITKEGLKANYKAKAAGNDEIVAGIGKVEFTKSIEVKDRVLARLEITGGSDQGTVGDTVSFKVIGYDQAGKEMEVKPEWTLSGDVAKLSKAEGQQADINYVRDGEFVLTASSGNVKNTVNVTIQKKKYMVTTIVSGKGTIEKNPDAAQYFEDSEVTLKALPQDGWHFLKWTGSVTGSKNPVSLTVNENKNITAVFEINKYTLKTEVSGQGDIIRSIVKDTYDYGTVVKLTASPKAGYRFDHWEGNASGNATVISLKMDGNKSVKAVFVYNEAPDVNEYTLKIEVTGNGSVKQEKLSENKIRLTAQPGQNSQFSYWEGDISGSANPAEIIMDRDKTVKAVFYDLIKVSGKVMNSKNQNGIADAQINIRTGKDNQSGTVYKSIRSDAQGMYTIELPKGDYTFEVSKDGFTTNYENVTAGNTELTQNIVLNEINQEAQFRIVLTWNESPDDLDSHLMMPDSNGYQEVYYDNDIIFDESGNELALLDVDDTDGFGPETITIKKMNHGKYTYYVHDYTESGTINTSNAQVKVYKNNELVKTFNIPNTAGKNYWHVFDIIDNEVVIVNTLLDSEPQY